MNANEIMIGDYLRMKYRNKTIIKVIAISQSKITYTVVRGYAKGVGTAMLHQIEPIPLDSELLEKIGWKQSRQDEDLFCYAILNTAIPFSLYREFSDTFDVTIEVENGDQIPISTISFIHDIQHAFRFFKIDEEIFL